MPIEINELTVNATIEGEPSAADHENIDGRHLDLEDLRVQLLSECTDLFYELLDKQKDR